MDKTIEGICARLGLPKDAFASGAVLLLPENALAAESPEGLYDTDDAVYLAKYMKHQGVECKTSFDLGLRPKVRERRGFDVWLGIACVTGAVIVPTFVNVLSTYLFERYFKPRTGNDSSEKPAENPTIHVDLRFNGPDGYSAIQFDGPATDLILLLEGFKRLRDQESWSTTPKSETLSLQSQDE